MENKDTNAADPYSLIVWLHANHKRLILLSAIVLVVAAGIGIFIWHGNHQESQASEALSNLKSPLTGRDSTNAADAAAYLKIASDYPNTAGGARALLIAGGILFNQGKFQQAQEQYEKFLHEHADYPLANEAALGVAASLEAQGKATEAIARYEDVVKNHQANSTSPQAKASLARLYLAQNKPDNALKVYEEMVKEGRNNSWNAEAEIQMETLLNQHPDLRKQPALPQVIPTATLPTPQAAPAKP